MADAASGGFDIFGNALGSIGGFVGSLFGGGDRDEAMRRLELARQAYSDLNPTITAQPIQSAYLSADPSTRAAQMDALSQLQNKYRSGGLDAIDQANLAAITNQANRTGAINRAAVMDQAARRGMGTSGNALVGQLVGGQQASNQAAQQALQAAAQAQQARMGAIQGAAGLAGNIRGQDYDKAAALDQVSRFNEANRLQSAQNTFGNALNRAQGVAGEYGQEAGQKNADALWTQQRWAGLGQGIGGTLDAGAKAAGSYSKLLPFLGG